MNSSQQMNSGMKDQASQAGRIYAFVGGAAKSKRLLSAAALAMAISLFSFLTALPAGALAGSSFNALDGALDGATGLIVQNDTPSGVGDNSFAEGVHEDTAVPPVEVGSVPDKANLLKFHLAIEKAGGQDFLYVSWERQPDRGGTTDMDFEFNQSATLSANGVTPIRTVGDLLITYALSNGGDQVEMAYRLWEGTNWGSEHSLAGFAEGSFNTDPVTGDHYFGEAVVNLTASGLFPAGNCVNFGSAFLKSRSSHSFESKMKDFIAPVPVLISNCGTIVITKDAVPNGETDFSFTTTGTGLSAFSLDDDANATLPSSKVFANLQPGSYTVTEAAVGGFDLTSLTCNAGTGASGTRNGSSADITVVAGSQVACTFVNTAQPAHLNVIKHVVNDNGGSATADDFAISVTGTDVSTPNFNGQESPGTSVELKAGSYGVTEEASSGYAASYSADCRGTIERGATKTCTVTNDDQPPGLTVVKQVINDNGGTKLAPDFTMNVEGTLPDPSTFPGDEDGTEVSINSGAYSVSEAPVSGYAGTLSADCTGTIALGQTKTCTISNNDIQPRLMVIKNVINDNGGTKTAADFTMHVAEAGEDPDPFPGSAIGTQVDIRAGAYEVTEGDHEGYEVSYSQDCEGSIGVGETRTCTVTNDDVQPKLIVKKVVINDNGGTALAGAFTLNVTGSSPSPASVPGSETGNDVAINAGSYSVAETEVDGYAASYSDNCSGTIAVGQTRTCTVTNNDVPPGLTVVKHVINDNGGTKNADDFTIDVSGISADPDNFPGDEDGTKVDLKVGAFEVTEGSHTGYTVSYSEDCAGSIGVGQTKVCTVTNDDIQPKLIVKKVVVNDNGGTLAAEDFTMNVSAETPAPASFPGDVIGTEVLVDAGDYEVTELEVAGYEGTFSDNCEGSIGIGQTRTCTVTNDDIQPELTVIKNVVNDNGGTKVAGDFDLSVTGIGADPSAFDGSEDGVKVKLDIGAYSVSEAPVAGYAGTLSADCTGTIALGQTKTCTITNNDIQPRLTVIKNVINDNGGTLVPADFDLEVNVDEEATTPGLPSSFDGSAEGTLIALDAGTYNVTETEVDGYAGTLSAACSGVLVAGETRTCTVTNIDLPAGLTVIKRVINDNGGTRVASDFEISVAAAGPDPADFDGSETGRVLEINAGEYAVTEQNLDGYRGARSADCEGTIALDEALVCIITNDDIQPTLTVIKRVINDNGGTRAASSFDMLVGGVTQQTFKGSENGTRVALNAGQYTADEASPGTYVKTRSADCSGTIAVGETRTCTITNNDAPAEVLGVVIENPPAEAKPTVEVLGVTLAKTGLDIAMWSMLALALIGGGFALLWFGRKQILGKK